MDTAAREAKRKASRDANLALRARLSVRLRDQHAARNMLVFAGIYSPEELGGALVEPGTTARERAQALSLVSAGDEARNEHSQEGEPISRSEAAEKRHRLQRCP